MASSFEAKIDVIPGPVMRTALDVLDLIIEVLPLIPEWHQKERLELGERAKTLVEIATHHIRMAGNAASAKSTM